VPIPVDLLVEINTIPARLVDASTSGVQFEMYRPHGYSVPASLRLSSRCRMPLVPGVRSTSYADG